MCSRRNKPVFQAFVFLGLAGSLGYFVYLYNTITLKLDRSDRQLNKYVKHQKSLSAQLQVVYEHRARLEKSFEKEKLEHKKTKQELAESKRNFYINITRTRHETLNRFNSLETQHRMVKAKHEHLQLEYNRLQQQHARLSAEHVAVHNQQVNSFNAMKSQKENEILGLEAQIKTLKKQVATWKRQYVTEHDEAEYYKGLHEKALQDIENHKATILRLYERIKRRQPNAGTILKDQKIPTFHESKPAHAHRVGNADARPGHDHVTKATVFPVRHEVERKTEPVHEDVDTKTKKNINEEEEADDNDEDNGDTRQRAAQIPQTTQATYTPPPIYVSPQPSQASDVFRPDILKQREQETGDHKSRGSQDAPVILHDRSVRDSMPVALTVKRVEAGESEGEPKADNEGEEETEEQKVLKYLSRNAANAGNSQQQEQQQQQRQQQQQQQRQQREEQQQQQHQEEQKQQQQEQEQRQQSQPQQQQQQQQQERHQQAQEQQSDSRTVDSPDRQVRDVHSEEEQQQESQDNTNQGPNIDLNRHQQYKQLNKPHQGLSKLRIRDSSKESNKNDKNSRPDDSNAEQKRLRREEQFRRPIPRPGGGDKRRTGEEDSEHIEPQGDENNRGKKPNVQEEENDNEEDDNGEAEKDDERDNTIDQKNNENQANKRANRAENTKEGEEEEEEENERQRRPNRGARLRGLRQA